jgi:hypoxanthine phosphoribosyltransferase
MNMESTQPTSESPKAEKYKFHFEEIKGLLEPMKKILERLRPDIEAGAYQLVIGDDASGRIPTLIVSKVIKEIYRTKGYPELDIRFIAGGGSGYGQTSLSEITLSLKEHVLSPKILSERRELIREIKDDSEGKLKRALIVTDIIETGKSLRPLVTALNSEGMAVDIAAVNAAPENRKYYSKNILGSRVINGCGSPNIYSKPYISGVEKNVGDLFAESYKKVQEHGIPPEDIQKDIYDAREDVKEISRRLMDWYRELVDKDELAGTE